MIRPIMIVIIEKFKIFERGICALRKRERISVTPAIYRANLYHLVIENPCNKEGTC